VVGHRHPSSGEAPFERGLRNATFTLDVRQAFILAATTVEGYKCTNEMQSNGLTKTGPDGWCFSVGSEVRGNSLSPKVWQDYEVRIIIRHCERVVELVESTDPDRWGSRTWLTESAKQRWKPPSRLASLEPTDPGALCDGCKAVIPRNI
jgi:hypothetical protein